MGEFAALFDKIAGLFPDRVNLVLIAVCLFLVWDRYNRDKQLTAINDRMLAANSAALNIIAASIDKMSATMQAVNTSMEIVRDRIKGGK